MGTVLLGAVKNSQVFEGGFLVDMKAFEGAWKR